MFILGERCEYERNQCEPVNPCLNAGRCISQLNNFSCICNPGMIEKENVSLFFKGMIK
jgi:hypothetical protein